MKKAFFLLNYRGGSNLLEQLNGSHTVYSVHSNKSYPNPAVLDSDRIVSFPGWNTTHNSYWMNTIPFKTAISENLYTPSLQEIITLDIPLDLVTWVGNVGDWWGEVSDADHVPDPYGVETFYRFGPNELGSLPGEWKFIYMIRDGRNLIESFRNIKGGWEEKRHKANRMDFFKVLCKGFRNRARMAIDCNNQLSNFKLFHFEDFIVDPVRTIESMYNFIGVELDKQKAKQALDFNLSLNTNHSSFSGKKFNERYTSWTNEELDIFNCIAERELKELGYC